jgi:hypothetical protein
MNFSTATGTMTVAFEDYVANPQPLTVSTEGLTTATVTATTTVLNYVAPRKNGVYLQGAELDDFICMLASAPMSGALTEEEIEQLAREMVNDNPSEVIGGDELRSKHIAYLRAQGTPEEVIAILAYR